MMRLGRRASRIVAFSLLASAATAYAECAWVLWSYTAIGGDELYGLDSAHPSLRDCESGLSDYAAVLKKGGYILAGGGYVPGSRRIQAHKGTERASYLCIPDTVDPRGPKGK